MPKAAPRPCRETRCTETTNHTSGYCDLHPKLQQSRWAKHQAEQGTAKERGYGYAWTKLARQIKQRDGYLCMPCKDKGRNTEAKAVDHIVPKSRGGTDDLDNLQSICGPCHATKTAKEGRAHYF